MATERSATTEKEVGDKSLTPLTSPEETVFLKQSVCNIKSLDQDSIRVKSANKQILHPENWALLLALQGDEAFTEFVANRRFPADLSHKEVEECQRPFIAHHCHFCWICALPFHSRLTHLGKTFSMTDMLYECGPDQALQPGEDPQHQMLGFPLVNPDINAWGEDLHYFILCLLSVRSFLREKNQRENKNLSLVEVIESFYGAKKHTILRCFSM
ncbi:unnamed protein product [Cuscuta campestris]|uniref:Uncharacterized protein n=1 Tax=Cuscuta campestris TaxID=132261 RepID=A0A484NSS0_9ASTE|nr:unnamed protein product [Cuscuta campestris]